MSRKDLDMEWAPNMCFKILNSSASPFRGWHRSLFYFGTEMTELAGGCVLGHGASYPASAYTHPSERLHTAPHPTATQLFKAGPFRPGCSPADSFPKINQSTRNHLEKCLRWPVALRVLHKQNLTNFTCNLKGCFHKNCDSTVSFHITIFYIRK